MDTTVSLPAPGQTFGRRVRSVVLRCLDMAGVPNILLATKRGRGTIVLYHGVTRQTGSGIFNYRGKHVHTDAFAQHIAWMHQHYTVMSLKDMLAHPDLAALPKPALAITFDDGYKNNYTDAFPILRSTNTPATFFVTTGFIAGSPLPVDTIEHAVGVSQQDKLMVQIDNREHTLPLATRADRIAADTLLRATLKKLNPRDSQIFRSGLITSSGINLADILESTPYAPMNWSEITEMSNSGMDFAPHTLTHPILSYLSPVEQHIEIMQSQKTLQDTLPGKALSVFAYPNGGTNDYNTETISILQNAGFTASLTTQPGTVGRHSPAFELPRYTLDGTNDMYRFRLTITGAR